CRPFRCDPLVAARFLTPLRQNKSARNPNYRRRDRQQQHRSSRHILRPGILVNPIQQAALDVEQQVRDQDTQAEIRSHYRSLISGAPDVQILLQREIQVNPGHRIPSTEQQVKPGAHAPPHKQDERRNQQDDRQTALITPQAKKLARTRRADPREDYRGPAVGIFGPEIQVHTKQQPEYISELIELPDPLQRVIRRVNQHHHACEIAEEVVPPEDAPKNQKYQQSSRPPQNSVHHLKWREASRHTYNHTQQIGNVIKDIRKWPHRVADVDESGKPR